VEVALESEKPKVEILRESGTLNSNAKEVQDAQFLGSNFFDPRDLLQVKYEMLRRVQEGLSVAQAASTFGFSRPSFYKAQSDFTQAGLPGLIPRKRGPQGGHKLTDEIIDFVEKSLQEKPGLNALILAEMVERQFDVNVHARSIQRALNRRSKKN